MSEKQKSRVMTWPFLVGGPVLGYLLSYQFQPDEFKEKVPFGNYVFSLKDTLFGYKDIAATAWICIFVGFMIGLLIAFIVSSVKSAPSENREEKKVENDPPDGNIPD